MFILIFTYLNSFAIYDWIATQGKEVAEGMAVASAVSELAKTMDEANGIVEDVDALENISRNVKKKIDEVSYLSEESKRLSKGVDQSTGRLSSNIRNTSAYLKRLKSVMSRFLALGAGTATAIGTMENAAALNEIQKNQQTMIVMEKNNQLLRANEKIEERKKWDEFLSKEKKKRWGKSI